jgi:hypothetical protein
LAYGFILVLDLLELRQCEPDQASQGGGDDHGTEHYLVFKGQTGHG